MPGNPLSGRRAFAARFADLPTGIKMLSIISLALVPLGLIALLASLQSNRTADLQRRADVRVAVTEGTRKLGSELSLDIDALTSAANALESGAKADEVCSRLGTILHSRSAQHVGFVLFAPDRSVACKSRGYAAPPLPMSLESIQPNVMFGPDGIDVRIFAKGGLAAGVAHYPASSIAEMVRPIGISVPNSLMLTSDGRELSLATRQASFLVSSETFEAPVGVLGLGLRMSVERAPFSATELLLTFLPLLMWASAAAVGFLVVDRLLIRPLAQLRAAVAGLQPGDRFAVPEIRTPALEIRELAETFGRVGETLSAHEARLAAALADQTKLTREVHHRVKNNLQVIASLISLHARGAAPGPVAGAYASIQRRVDALAIVHRNHYAELEAGGGISLKALIGELATNLRLGFAVTGAAPAIAASTPALYVTQDIAVPIAFLLTELAEMSIAIDPTAPMIFAVDPAEAPRRACVSVTSLGLRASEAFDAKLAERYGRIIDGLSRQLRFPMSHDGITGRYAIEVAVLPENHE